MQTLLDYASIALYCLAGFGLVTLLMLASIGWRMVYAAFSFAVRLAFAEYQNKKLSKASEAVQEKFSTPTDTNADTQTQTPKATGSTKPKR
jgi:hypothetical protein